MRRRFRAISGALMIVGLLCFAVWSYMSITAPGFRQRAEARAQADFEMYSKAHAPETRDGILPQTARRDSAQYRSKLDREATRLELRIQNSLAARKASLLGTFVGAYALFGIGVAMRRPLLGQDLPADGTAFISYNHKNLPLAQSVRVVLSERGCEGVLIDRLLEVESETELKRILDAVIKEHVAMICVLTPESLRSNWVAFERFVGEHHSRAMVYVLDRVSTHRAVCVSHFPSFNKAFRKGRLTRARRNYISMRSGDWPALVEGLVRSAPRPRGWMEALDAVSCSITSFDLMLLAWLRNTMDLRELRGQFLGRTGGYIVEGIQGATLIAALSVPIWCVSVLVRIYS